MPKLAQDSLPSYRLHKARGLAVVTLSGKDFYLGPYDTDLSRAAYDRLVSEWVANGRRLPASPCVGHPDITITELIAAYWSYAEGYYVKDGQPTNELSCIRSALRPLQEGYGRTAAAGFGPLALKAIRQQMIGDGRCRKYINDQVSRIKQVFRWAVSNELVPPSTYHGLQALDGLRKGRTAARESLPVRPVADADITAVRPFVSPQVWAMLQLQRLTGMRPGEVVQMRGADLDTSGDLWEYRPRRHKTEHHSRERVIPLGPLARAAVRSFLKPDLQAYLFDPRDAEAERRAQRTRNRKTPMSCGNRPGRNRIPSPKRAPRDHYTVDSYRRAIVRACDRADQAEKHRLSLLSNASPVITQWHPHQLRHNHATEVRKRFGIEAARVMLGHSSAAVTEIYAEMDQTMAKKIAAEIG